MGQISNKRKMVINNNIRFTGIEEIDTNNDVIYHMKNGSIPKNGCPENHGLENYLIELCVSDDDSISINTSEKHCESCWRLVLDEAIKSDIDLITNKVFLTRYLNSINLDDNINYIKFTFKKENGIINKFTIEILYKEGNSKSVKKVCCETDKDMMINKINHLSFDVKRLFNLLSIICSHNDHDSLVCTMNNSKNELGNSVSMKYIDRF